MTKNILTEEECKRVRLHVWHIRTGIGPPAKLDHDFEDAIAQTAAALGARKQRERDAEIARKWNTTVYYQDMREDKETSAMCNDVAENIAVAIEREADGEET